MRRHKDLIALICAIVISVIAAFLLQPSKAPETQPPAIDAPVPEDHSPFDYLVKVTAHNPNDSHVGVGTLVGYDGYTFVLTSKMIFTEGDEAFTVTYRDTKFSAELITIWHRLGLAALKVKGGPFKTLSINDAPNLPPYVNVEVYGLNDAYDVTIDHYLTNPDWMILTGGVPGTCTGAPILHDGLAGVVIGVNTENPEEAFAVGNHAIRTFADSVITDSSHRWEPLIFQQKPNNMRNVFREPANPNILSQGR
jgi:hypothetical protein